MFELTGDNMDNSDVHMIYVLLDGVGDLPHPDLDGKNTTRGSKHTNSRQNSQQWRNRRSNISRKRNSPGIRYCSF